MTDDKTTRPKHGEAGFEEWAEKRAKQRQKRWEEVGVWEDEPLGPLAGRDEAIEQADREDRMETPPANDN